MYDHICLFALSSQDRCFYDLTIPACIFAYFLLGECLAFLVLFVFYSSDTTMHSHDPNTLQRPVPSQPLKAVEEEVESERQQLLEYMIQNVDLVDWERENKVDVSSCEGAAYLCIWH